MGSFEKQTFVQFQVTSSDLLKANTDSWPRNPSHRSTWPTHPRGSRPGTYTFDSVPTLVRTPWELQRSRRPASQWSRGSTDRRSISSGTFARLPAEVLHCALDQLSTAHSTEATINARDLQADLRTLCLSNKKLYQVASEHLYREIWTPSQPGGVNRSLKKFHRPKSRLRMLLRTLRGNADLAATVRCIRVSSRLADALEGEVNYYDQPLDRTSAVQVLSDVIRCCPNLEQLLGFAPNATDNAVKLYTALAACTKLKSHVWRLQIRSLMNSSTLPRPEAFMNCLENWSELKTLVITIDKAGRDMPPGTISAVLQKLPSLQHLVLDGLYPADFHNGTSLMLPALKSLRLEELHGITDQGLEQLAHSRLSFSLERLSLCGLELTSIRTIHALFSEMKHLKRFTLQQDTAPQLSQTHLIANTNFSLSSSSLQYLQWDTLSQGHGVTVLANSIASGRFPHLRKVKVPCDFDGVIQQLCRPMSSRPLTPEDFHTVEVVENNYGYSGLYSLSSQIYAQIRIRECRRQPSFNS